MKRFLALAAVIPALAFAACGGSTTYYQTADQACQAVDSNLDTDTGYNKDSDGTESYCLDGSQIENEGQGWFLDGGAGAAEDDEAVAGGSHSKHKKKASLTNKVKKAKAKIKVKKARKR